MATGETATSLPEADGSDRGAADQVSPARAAGDSSGDRDSGECGDNIEFSPVASREAEPAAALDFAPPPRIGADDEGRLPSSGADDPGTDNAENGEDLPRDEGQAHTVDINGFAVSGEPAAAAELDTSEVPPTPVADDGLFGEDANVSSNQIGNGENVGSEQTDAESPGASSREDGGAEPQAKEVPRKNSTEAPGIVGPPDLGSEKRRIWRPRYNRCPDETDQDKSWYEHKRHVLIFTYSGKPVYTRYGSEEGIVSTTGALSAIVSKIQNFFFVSGTNDDQDSLRYMMAGDNIFVFVERGPLWLVCVSRCGDTYADVVRMLDRVHLQIITILTAGIERTLVSRPNYDMRSLLGGTDGVVNNMIRWCVQDLQVDGFEPLPLSPQHRTSAVDALRGARVSNVLCGFLLAGQRVIAIVSNRQYKHNANDLQALINLVMSSASLRTGESWTPVCLVHFNDKAFAYAYISFVEGTDIGVVFLSTASDGDQFYEISKQSTKIKQILQKSGCLDAAINAMDKCPIDFRAASAAAGEQRSDRSGRKSLLASCPPTQWKLLECTIHAAYFVPSLQQYFSSAIAPPYHVRRRTKMLFRSYGRCRHLLRNAKQPCQICVATDHECFYVFLASEFHLYLAVPRGTSTGVIGQIYQWFRAQEGHILLGNIPTW